MRRKGNMQNNDVRCEGQHKEFRLFCTILTSIVLMSAVVIAQDTSEAENSPHIERILRSVQSFREMQPSGNVHMDKMPLYQKTLNGHLRSLVAPESHHFPVSSVIHGDAQATARNFLSENKEAFGTTRRGFGWSAKRIRQKVGHSHTRFGQTYAGITVFGAETIVQLNAEGGVEYVSSDIVTDREPFDTDRVSTVPAITGFEAEQIAIDIMSENNPGLLFDAKPATLMIYQPSVIGNDGSTQLVWHTQIISIPEAWVGELVLVDAHTGEIALQYSLKRKALYREIYTVNCSLELDTNTLVRVEGESSCSIDAADLAYHYAGDAYDFYYKYHGRNSIDDAGMPIRIFVGLCSEWDIAAFWDPMNLCILANNHSVTDDIIGHEYTHGVTQYESGLLYINESGAIDESFSDMWGEWIDQSNGMGNDSDNVKWWLGEDVLPLGYVFEGGKRGFRYMKDPSQSLPPQPDCMESEHWFEWLVDPLADPNYDNGGVHINSGVNNKLCYLLTDGDSFRGYQVNGMGTEAVADLYYKVQTDLLTQAADYRDLYFALKQAAKNLQWNVSNQQNLDRACRAVGIWSDVLVYPASNMDEKIYSNSTLRSTLEIEENETIEDLNIKIEISHAWMEDLDVYLIAPDGTAVQLFTDIGGNQNFLLGTILDDEASISIIQGKEPYNGSYRPEGQLSVLKGKNIKGTWILEIKDDWPNDYGQSGWLDGWCLFIDVVGNN